MNILVTGGAGYIGSHITRYILRRDLRPVVLDNLVYGHRESVPRGVPFYHGQIADSKLVAKIIRQEKINAVMHFSAYAYVGESVENPQKYYENNFCQTQKLLETLLAHDIKYFIFSSTCATYGIHATTKLSETLPQNPINPYGFTKLAVERMLSDYSQAYGLHYAALRYFNAAGADDDGAIGEAHDPETHLIPLALQSILNPEKQLKIFGTDYPTPDGTCVRDYIHVYDLAAAHLQALDYIMRKKTSDCFNLGSENGYSVKAIIQTCEKISGLKVNYQETVRRAGDPAYLVADSSKAHKILGWQARYDLEKIIATAWQWEKYRRY
ncbi:UDP-glucose 4-epimerase [Candidatus Termititenax persephonae]|uniref:UDP-glucose 4-epimerase n=1 Tax=Candidatus Termititenax persephonae TaxID=2218525 RepID=A0A388TEM8_9BACT|nr:UDP-glucose 4-epimerase [Candidatus Termititenax persephonae]